MELIKVGVNWYVFQIEEVKESKLLRNSSFPVKRKKRIKIEEVQ
jgi:hypothetical protein